MATDATNFVRAERYLLCRAAVSTQKVIVSNQIPDGFWRETEAVKVQTIHDAKQIWRFSTSGTYGESAKRFKVTDHVGGRVIDMEDNDMALYPGESAFVLGEKGIERDCGTRVHTYYLKTTVNGIASIDNNNGSNYSIASPTNQTS